MKATRTILALVIALAMLALWGCGGQTPSSAQKAGVVFVDPNAAASGGSGEAKEVNASSSAASAAPKAAEAAQPAEGTAQTGEAETNAPLDLYYLCRGVRVEPMMEAAPVLAALGDPIRSFEADSCAYVGKDLFYAYPGVQLTVNEVEGVERITVITVTDDTVTIPQGLRIYDDEEKLLSLLGGSSDNGVYVYENGRTELIIQVKETEDQSRRISYIEYRAAEEQ